MNVAHRHIGKTDIKWKAENQKTNPKPETKRQGLHIFDCKKQCQEIKPDIKAAELYLGIHETVRNRIASGVARALRTYRLPSGAAQKTSGPISLLKVTSSLQPRSNFYLVKSLLWLSNCLPSFLGNQMATLFQI